MEETQLLPGDFSCCLLTLDHSLLWGVFESAQSYSPFKMRLLRQKPLRDESLSFVSLYLNQGEIKISQLQPRPSRQASDLSQARGIADCGSMTIIVEETNHGWDKVLKPGS